MLHDREADVFSCKLGVWRWLMIYFVKSCTIIVLVSFSVGSRLNEGVADAPPMP